MAAGAEYVVSRDNDLLDLMTSPDPDPDPAAFRAARSVLRSASLWAVSNASSACPTRAVVNVSTSQHPATEIAAHQLLLLLVLELLATRTLALLLVPLLGGSGFEGRHLPLVKLLLLGDLRRRQRT